MTDAELEADRRAPSPEQPEPDAAIDPSAETADPWTRWLPAPIRALDRPLPAARRDRPLDPVRSATSRWARSRTGSLRTRSASARSSTSTTSPFRIPEIALDVLVAAGLTAPFVPIFSSLRRDDERGGERLRPDGPDGGGRS